MKWIEFFFFFTYKIKISQQEFWLTNAKMWDLLTPSNCIRSPPFTPSSPPLHQPNSPGLGVGGWGRVGAVAAEGQGGGRFFWLNAAFANIKDYIVSTGVKYRHEMHQFHPPFTDSGLVRPSGDVRKINPVKDLTRPRLSVELRLQMFLKCSERRPSPPRECSSHSQATALRIPPESGPNGYIYQPEHVKTHEKQSLVTSFCVD